MFFGCYPEEEKMLRVLKVSRVSSGWLKSLHTPRGHRPKLGSLKRLVSTSAIQRHERLHEVLPPLESFSRRHIGPSDEEVAEMLKTCGVEVRTRG